MMKRRDFIRNSAIASAAIAFPKWSMAKTSLAAPRFRLSLAQWSFHKAIFSGALDPLDFAKKSQSLGFEGVEYVNTLYNQFLSKYSNVAEGMEALGKELFARSEEHGMKNVLIMIDAQGDLAAQGKGQRIQAVDNHKKWVDLASFLGCHSIRVNLNGAKTLNEWKEASADGLRLLGAYGKENNINVLVENHGGFSSNGLYLAEVMQMVGEDNVGTLPDFGNFCIKYGTNGCEEQYDKYKGMEELMPFAKAVSAKSNNFDENGNETGIDYPRIMEIVKKSDYSGFIGVEYEGNVLSEEEGIIATRDLLKKLF
jgi:sugar phosphate isomerase/epimerase